MVLPLLASEMQFIVLVVLVSLSLVFSEAFLFHGLVKSGLESYRGDRSSHHSQGSSFFGGATALFRQRLHQTTSLESSTNHSSSPHASSEKDLVFQQLGYLPTNFVCVSARLSSDGVTPIAIQTYPLQGGSPRRRAKSSSNNLIGTPFPTLYWLTNPDISRAIADLERRGFVSKIEAILHSNSSLVDQLYQCHQVYAMERWNSLSAEDRALISVPEMQRVRNMLEHSGVAGTNFTAAGVTGCFPSIKCLHGHYADYRSSMHRQREMVNPVGKLVHELLQKEFPDLDL